MTKDKSHFAIFIAVVITLFTIGCSNTSYLVQGEKLYTGAEVNIAEGNDVEGNGELKDQLDLLVKPEPNQKFLGLFRLKLWLYNIGIFKESLGEPPVLLQQVSPDRVAVKMRTLMENKGYFISNVLYTIHEEEKTADIQYNISIQVPYKLHSIIVIGNNDALLDSIRSIMKETILIPGDQYDLDKLKQERERIDAALKGKGYFYFSPDYLLFQADSTAGDRSIDLSLQLKKDIPDEATRSFTIGNIYIYSGYSLNRDSTVIIPADSLIGDGVYYIDNDKEFTPEIITSSIFFKKGERYNIDHYDLTLSRLMNLGVFKFVNIRFEEADSAGVPRLNLHIYLTPLLIKTIRFELQAVSKSNNLAGPVFESSFRHKNLLGSAELLKLSFNVGFEMPVGGGQTGGNSYEIGTRGELELPKFVAPFTFEDMSSLFVPKTHITLGVNLLHRLQYYQMFSVDASFGYNWKQSQSIEHNFNPLSITFAQLTKATAKFNDLLSTNPLLRKSFEEQFIIGENYSFTYNDQFEKDQKNHLYFKGGIDLSGNILQLVQSIFTSHKATPETPYKFFGMTYSQYYKFDIDTRFYYNSIDQSSSLIGRLIAGIGIAHGNSATLPYVKQFYIGGSNSVRAFIPRGLGPGSYKIPDSASATSFIDQAGDIKLETNIEYRFPIVSILKGALFVDAGNIWLLRDDPSRPGGMFSGKSFMDEIAVGTGFGFRIDLSFFVIRLDIAIPLRIPSLPDNERWIFKKIDFGDPSWRKNNLLLNIAIGYPF